MYRKRLSRTKQALLSEVLLLKTMEIQLNECAETSVAVGRRDDIGNATSSSMDTTLLVTTLELVALEKLMAVRHVMVRELHSKQFPVVNEFEVLYAYKCGLLEECVKMCRRDIGMLLRSGRLANHTYSVAIPEMLSLLDGELVSLFGIIRLLCLNSVYEFPYYWQIKMLTLLLYLLVRCQQ